MGTKAGREGLAGVLGEIRGGRKGEGIGGEYEFDSMDLDFNDLKEGNDWEEQEEEEEVERGDKRDLSPSGGYQRNKQTQKFTGY